MIVAVTGATISGKINATLIIFENLLFRLLRIIATPIPNPISIAVLKNAYLIVTHVAFKNSFDARICVQFLNPTKLYVGILKEKFVSE